MEELYISTSIEETQEIAAKIVSELGKGTMICLWGDLAAGKTTFTQGVAKSLGIDRLTSPTFIIMREYQAKNHQAIKTLYHMDLYRLESSEDIKSFDIEELLLDSSNLVIIEWPEKMEDTLPKDRIDVFIKATDDNEREIKIIKH